MERQSCAHTAAYRASGSRDRRDAPGAGTARSRARPRARARGVRRVRPRARRRGGRARCRACRGHRRDGARRPRGGRVSRPRSSARPRLLPSRATRARATRGRAGGTDTPPGTTEKGRADAEARDRGGPSDDPKRVTGDREARFDENGAVRTEFLRDRYIVRFSEYKMIGAHRAALQAVLGRPSNEKELDPALYGTFLDDATTTPDEPTGRKNRMGVYRAPEQSGGVSHRLRRRRVSGVERDEVEESEKSDVTNRFATRDTCFAKHEGEPTATTTRLTSSAIPSSSADLHLASLIESVAGVRDVRPEQRFTRALVWDESERHSSNGESGDGGIGDTEKETAFSSRSRRFNAGASDESRRASKAPSSRRAAARRAVFPRRVARRRRGGARLVGSGRVPRSGWSPRGSSTRTRRKLGGAGTLAARSRRRRNVSRRRSQKPKVGNLSAPDARCFAFRARRAPASRRAWALVSCGRRASPGRA